MYKYILLTHLLAAAIWTGGHLVLALSILPQALKEKSITDLLRFESAFEKVGIPALLVQILSGIWLAHNLLPQLNSWLDLSNPYYRLIMMKLGLLLLTAAFAIDARLRVIPNLSVQSLKSLAYHVIPVTLISVLFVFVGVSFRTGSLFN